MYVHSDLLFEVDDLTLAISIRTSEGEVNHIVTWPI